MTRRAHRYPRRPGPPPRRSKVQASLEAARERAHAPTSAATDAVTLRDGIIHFFDPVFDIFDELHASGFAVTDGARVIPGSSFRNFIERMEEPPQVAQALDNDYTLIITLATRQTPRTITDLADAKWRCRVQHRDGPDLENKLIDNIDLLCDWIMQVLVEYEYAPSGSEDPAVQPADNMPPAMPTETISDSRGTVASGNNRERVIDLDDPHEE